MNRPSFFEKTQMEDIQKHPYGCEWRMVSEDGKWSIYFFPNHEKKYYVTRYDMTEGVSMHSVDSWDDVVEGYKKRIEEKINEMRKMLDEIK